MDEPRRPLREDEAIGDAFYERPLERTLLYRGRIIDVARYRVRLPDGREAEREVVHHPGAVAVLAVAEDGGRETIVLVRQYRFPLRRTTLEIPAGKLEPGADPLAEARRELAEETGFGAERWRKLGVFFSSPGFADEAMHLYEARGLVPGAPHPDADEFVRAERLTRDEAWAAVRRGEIVDLKTVLALLWWERQGGGKRGDPGP
ncbi:MAG: NUDIX hydrolase [Hydrogenibacillus schlegelii]|nr:NUDIX hydrolase [Hydrogenibacillus schlegelii]